MESELTKQEKIERLNDLIEEYEGCLPNRFYMNTGKIFSDKIAVHISYHDFSCTFHLSLENDWDTIVTETKKKVIQYCGMLAQCHVQRFINERIWDLEDNKNKDK
jgi:hypothetical protein